MQDKGKEMNNLVQIEPINKTYTEPEMPQLSDWEIHQKKAYIAFRKVVGFFYTKHSYGATRRYLLSILLPDKILYRWKPYQRGGCNRCGLCCKIVFKCPFYFESDTTTACMIYTSKRHAPPPCVVFPIDPFDLAEVQREVSPAPCPFYFEGQPEHPTTWGAVKAEIRSEFGKRVDKLKEAFNSL
ncbi:MAG: hypothetical protein IPL01_14305 [Acidobacteria bacterium]|nr:hypothetical protein [Acidobacteriota bacterium]